MARGAARRISTETLRSGGIDFMRSKWLVLVLIAAMVVAMSVVSCGDESTNEGASTTVTTAEAVSETETTASAETTDTTAGTTSEGATVLRLAAVDNETGYAGNAIQTFASELEKRTEGRYTVEVGWSCSLGAPGEFFDSVVSGLVDIAYFIPTTMPGVFPEADMFALPWVLPDAGIATEAIQTLVEQGYGMDDGMSEVKFLNVHMGPGHVLMTPKQVSSVKDFVGMKVITGGEMQSAAMEAIGATPVSFDQSEFYSALQKGIADANYNPWIAVAPWNLSEVIDCVLETNIGNVFCGFIMNSDSFSSMSAEDQQILDEVAEEYLTPLIVQGYADVTAVGKDAVLAKGGTVLQLSAEDLAFLDESFAGIWTDWIADAESKGVAATEACTAFYNILKDLGVETPAIGWQP
jgi:TRAP-type transport system periplasmic protein